MKTWLGWLATARGALASVVASLTLATLVVGCGGGSSTQAGVGSGGTGSYTSGPVSGFGSIIVNGIRYDDSSASVTDDNGAARVRSDVKLGMTVNITGSTVSSAQATAQRVQFGSELIGPIAAAPGASSFIVLGQTVKVNSKTAYGDGLTGLASLAADNVVEVYGLSDGQGNIIATRVERKSHTVASYAGSAFKLRGVLSGVDLGTHHLSIGGASIVYNDSAVRTALAVGALVRMQLNLVPVGGDWEASTIQTGVAVVAASQEAEVEGVISAVVGGTGFVVNGYDVQASAAVQAAAGGALTVGTRVEVHGTLAANALVASRMQVETEAGSESLELHGTISSFNSGAKTFVVKGTTVNYATASVSGVLADGVCVEAEGDQLINGSQVRATQVEVHDLTDCH